MLILLWQVIRGCQTGRKLIQKKKSEQFLLGHCPGLRQKESIKQQNLQLEQEHEAADRRSTLTTQTGT